MANQKKHIDDLPPVTLPMTGNELIPVSQAGVVKVMKPGDVAAFQGNYIKADGSIPFTGDQSMGGMKLKEIGQPVENEDAARLIDVMKNAFKWSGIGW